MLRNIDHLFRVSEVAGSGTTNSLFNSGVMVMQPSNCTFRILMDEMEKLVSEVKDEWDFLNRVFPWWHRIPKHMNSLKYFWTRQSEDVDHMNRLDFICVGCKPCFFSSPLSIHFPLFLLSSLSLDCLLISRTMSHAILNKNSSNNNKHSYTLGSISAQDVCVESASVVCNPLRERGEAVELF